MAKGTLGAIPPNEQDILKRKGKYSATKAANPAGAQDGGAGFLIDGDSRQSRSAEAKPPASPVDELNRASGTSIFDPVLCECIYTWFSPPGGLVLDPFAGGSVRGIVAAVLGREYTGIELRPEQIEANRRQALAILGQEATNGIGPMWIEGDAANVGSLAPGNYDLLFSCPPYYDLEVYSDLEGELSALPSYEEFLEQYRSIIASSLEVLNDNRFASFVVGDLRDQQGYYRNFVSDTIAAFEDAGAKLYNEAILITSHGSLPIRVGKQFQAGRKLGKTHQNVLIFVKGDWRQATGICGPVEVAEIAEDGSFV